MKARNGATFAELAVLRALRARGGEAPFSELSRLGIRGIDRVLRGMLPSKARPNTIGRRTASGRVRPGLIAREFRAGVVVYRLAAAGRAGAAFAGPWTQKTRDWAVEWTPERVTVTGGHGGFIARFAADGVIVEETMWAGGRPDVADWRRFRQLMKKNFGVNVPAEAVPDFVRDAAAG